MNPEWFAWWRTCPPPPHSTIKNPPSFLPHFSCHLSSSTIGLFGLISLFVFALAGFALSQQSSTAEVRKNTLGVVALIRPHYGKPVWDSNAGFLPLIAFDCNVVSLLHQVQRAKMSIKYKPLFQIQCNLTLDSIALWLFHVSGAGSFKGRSSVTED